MKFGSKPYYYLLGLGYKTFKKVRCEQLFGNIQYHFLYSVGCNEIYNNVLHTYLHNL